jgi:hypothetical protein
MGLIIAASAPGVDAVAVWQRISALSLLLDIQNDPQAQLLGLPWKKIEVTDATLSVLATIPMNMQPADGHFFDVNEFNRLVAEATTK